MTDLVKDLMSLTSDWFGASGATLSEQFSEAIGAVRLLIATSKALSGQRNLTVSTCETLAMPWVVLVGDATGCDNLE